MSPSLAHKLSPSFFCVSATPGILQAAGWDQRPEGGAPSERREFTNSTLSEVLVRYFFIFLCFHVLQMKIAQLEQDIKNTRKNMKATFWFRPCCVGGAYRDSVTHRQRSYPPQTGLCSWSHNSCFPKIPEMVYLGAETILLHTSQTTWNTMVTIEYKKPCVWDDGMQKCKFLKPLELKLSKYLWS